MNSKVQLGGATAFLNVSPRPDRKCWQQGVACTLLWGLVIQGPPTMLKQSFVLASV